LPNTTSTINYAINGGTSQNIAGIVSDAIGNASFAVVLSEENNGQSLTISSIERTDTSSCPHTLSANNSVVLSVHPSPTVVSVNSISLCGNTGTTTISLTGLIPNTTSNISYSIAGGTGTTLTGLISDATGKVTFDLPLISENNGQILEITSITRTDISPNCNSVLSGITTALVINERPTATVTGDQAVCFGSISSDITVTLTGTAPWNIVYTDGNGSFPVTNIMTSPYTFTVGTFSTKTYTVTALEDATCTANPSDISGSATVTVNPVSNGGNIIGSNSVCTGTNNGTLTLENHVGNVVKWQSSPTIDFSVATDITNTTATLEYANLFETTYYRAVVSNSPCAALNSTIAAITVNETQAPITQSQTFCNSGTIADLFPNTTGIQWYSSSFGGTALLPTEALATGDYYATMTIDGCESARTLTSVTVNQTPAPTTQAQTFCNSGTIADLLPNTTGIQWYSLPAGGTPLLPNEALATGNYYATMTVDGCESARTLTSVVVNTASTPTGEATQEFTEGETLEAIEITGTNVEWYSSEEAAELGTAPLDMDELLTDGTTYYAVEIANECRSNAFAVTVSMALKTPEFSIENLKVYPNPFTDTVTVSYSESIDSVEVYNLLGQKLIEKTATDNEIKLDMSSLNSGTYLLKAYSGKASKTFKIIKR
jgi:Secretion system C-terminal sorting domain